MRSETALPPPSFGTEDALACATDPELDFAALFRAHGQFVLRVTKYLGVRNEDLSDVSQEVWLVVHVKLRDFDGREASVRTWLYSICIRTVSNHLRRVRHHRELLVDAMPEEGGPAKQDVELDDQAARALLASMVARLDKDERFVFVLHELEELPMPTVASIVGCPVQTAYTRHRRARQRLLKMIEQRAGKESLR